MFRGWANFSFYSQPSVGPETLLSRRARLSPQAHRVPQPSVSTAGIRCFAGALIFTEVVLLCLTVAFMSVLGIVDSILVTMPKVMP